MLGWALRRLLSTLFAVWAIASGVFLLSRHTAARFEDVALPAAEVAASGAAGATSRQQVARQELRQRLGLHLPLFYLSRGSQRWEWHQTNQYHLWLTQVVQGNMGVSFRTGQPVATRLTAALAYTVPLTGTALLLAVLAALGLGQGLAARSGWQGPVRSMLAALQALPLFVVAVLLLLLFANPEVFAWFPAYGLSDYASDAPWWQRAGTYARHLALPVAALVLTALPQLTLQLEAALAQELSAEYATTARAKGLPEGAVIRRHALRNALLPMATQIADLLPALVAGAVVVEYIFALPGMGRVLAEAAATRDYPVLLGGVLLTGAARLLALLLADLLYYWLDPRIRWQA